MARPARLIVDARPVLDGQPVAWLEFGGRPLLEWYLEAAAKAGVGRIGLMANGSASEAAWPGLVVEVLPAATPPEDEPVIVAGQVYSPYRLPPLLRRGRVDLSSALLWTIRSAEDVERAERTLERDLYYPLARRLNRLLVGPLVSWLERTPITPNMVTAASMLCGLAAAVLFASGETLPLIIGAALLQVGLTLDFVDGQLARRKRSESLFGVWFEAVADDVVQFAVIAGAWLAVLRLEPSAFAWAAGLAALFSYHVTLTRLWLNYRVAEAAQQKGKPTPGKPRPPSGTVGRALYWLAKGLTALAFLTRHYDVFFYLFTIAALFNQFLPLLMYFGLVGLLAWLAEVGLQYYGLTLAGRPT